MGLSIGLLCLGFSVPRLAQAQSNLKIDGSDAQVPSCLFTYTSTNCTGTPTVSGEGSTASATAFYEVGTAHRVGTVIPPKFFESQPAACNTSSGGSSQMLVDCSTFCPGIGFTSGTLTSGATACGVASAPYCACSGPGLVLVDHAGLVPATSSNPTGTCVPVDIYLYTSTNNPIPALAAIDVHVQDTGLTGKFYRDSACTVGVPNSISFAVSDMSKTVYYKDTAAETLSIQALIYGLPGHPTTSLTFY